MDELLGNPINVILLIAIVYLIYKILKPESGETVLLGESIAVQKSSISNVSFCFRIGVIKK